MQSKKDRAVNFDSELKLERSIYISIEHTVQEEQVNNTHSDICTSSTPIHVP